MATVQDLVDAAVNEMAIELTCEIAVASAFPPVALLAGIAARGADRLCAELATMPDPPESREVVGEIIEQMLVFAVSMCAGARRQWEAQRAAQEESTPPVGLVN